MAIRLTKLQASDLDSLDEKVVAYRHELGWSQQDLAKEAGCSRPTIARLEAGNTILSVTLIKVIEALNRGVERHDQQGKDGSLKKEPRRSRRRRPEGDHRSDSRNAESTSEAASSSQPKDSPAQRDAVKKEPGTDKAAKGNLDNKTGEQLQEEMFFTSLRPHFSEQEGA